MRVYESTGRTIEEAVSSGLEHLGVDLSDVKIDVLQEGSKGLFGFFGSRQAKVRLTVNETEEEESILASLTLTPQEPERKRAPRKKPQRQAEEAAKPAAEPKASAEKKPAEPKKAEPKKTEPKKSAPRKSERPEKSAEPPKEIVPAPQADPATAAGKAQQFLQELTKRMGVNVSVAVSTDEDGHVQVKMEGDTLGILIGRRGETLDALQYLTSLQVNKGQENYTRVTLDTENYRAKREEALIRLANRMASRAVKTGRKVSLEPMNPYERRILHSALQANPNVATHSEGEEPNRHVVITLNKEARPKQEPAANE